MIDFARLCDWAVGELSERESAEVDEHILGCDECARAARFLLALPDAVTGLARAGKVRFAATQSLVERIDRDGLPTRRYRVAPGEVTPCRATTDQVYAITRFDVDLADVDWVDGVMLGPDGTELMRFDEAPYDAREHALFLAEMGDVIRALPTMEIRVRLTARLRSGVTRELGEYGLSHTALGKPAR